LASVARRAINRGCLIATRQVRQICSSYNTNHIVPPAILITVTITITVTTVPDRLHNIFSLKHIPINSPQHSTIIAHPNSNTISHSNSPNPSLSHVNDTYSDVLR
jgi:hypothetical protein